MGSIVSTLESIWEDVMVFGRIVYKAVTNLALKFYQKCKEMWLEIKNMVGEYIGEIKVDKHNIDDTMAEIKKLLESQVS